MAITDQQPSTYRTDPPPAHDPLAPQATRSIPHVDPNAVWAPTAPPPTSSGRSGRRAGTVAVVVVLMLVSGAVGALVRQPAISSTQDELAAVEDELAATEGDLTDAEDLAASLEDQVAELEDQVSGLENDVEFTGERAEACEAFADAADRLRDLYQGWIVRLLEVSSPEDIDSLFADIEAGAGGEQAAVDDYNATVDACVGGGGAST